MNDSKKLYIVLTQTGTMVSKIIKFFTHAPFNHASITNDPNFCDMVSFSRYHRHLPLPAGFNHENLHTGVFSCFPNIPCEILSIDVTEEQYNDYLNLIEHFKINIKKYNYNILGLVTIPFGFVRQDKRRFVCSQFVAHVLKEINVATFDKDVSLITPDDLRSIKNSECVYSGNIKSFAIPKTILT